MINEYSLLASEILAKNLADRGVAVVSKGDSYLSNITGLSDIAAVIQSEGELSLNQKIQTLYNNPVHAEALDKLVKNINYANTSILTIAKNNVIPLVNFMADRYSTYIATAQNNAVLPLTVDVVEDDAYWENDLFREAVASMPVDYTDVVNLTITFPNKERDELLLMSKTGFARFDNLLTEAISKYEAASGIDVYEDVWSSIFSKTGARYLSRLDDYYKGDSTIIQYHLPVLWAILRYLTNESNIPSGVIGSIVDYRTFISNALVSVNSMLNTFIQGYDRSKKAKKMVIAFPGVLVDGKRQQVIRVRKTLYNEFLAGGGSVDAVLGSAISDREDTVPGLLEKKEDYESNWREHYALINSTITSEIREIKRLSIKKALIETAQEYEKQQLALDNPDIDPNAETISYRYQHWSDLPQDIQTYVEHLDDHKLSEINYISQQLICDLLFANTDVFKILDLINEYGKKDTNTNAKTALTLAVVDYVVNWCVEQLDFIQQ